MQRRAFPIAAFGWFPVFVSVLATFACRTEPATQVIVFFDAEPSLRAEASQLRVQVEGPDGIVFDDIRAVGSGSLARVPLIPRDGDATRAFRIEGTLLSASSETLARVEGSGSYREGVLSELRLWFEDVCRGIVCDRGQSCSAGVCVGACIEPEAPGVSDRTEPVCGECEQCRGGLCVALPDGESCGCVGDDVCTAGTCRVGTLGAIPVGGHLHTCSESSSGLYCWGSNRAGQIGEGGSSVVPVRVDVPSSTRGAAGNDHTCWLTLSGDRWCWGWNGNGNLGNGSIEENRFLPTVIDTPREPAWEELSAGWFFTCGLTLEGALYCWGANDRGQTGQDPASVSTVAAPTRVEDGTTWSDVDAGGFHACAIRADRTLWCWGLNVSGELGIGNTVDRFEPTQSGCAEDRCFDDWVSVSSGDFHTCAIRESGELWCWGGGLNGQLGAGPLGVVNSPTPLRVTTGSWRAVAAGQSHTCGITDDGELYCWGANDRGQLGTGDFTRRDEPALVRSPGGDSRWIRVALGRDHSCAVRSDESLWCWGWNEDGQVGNGEISPEVPVPSRVCFP